MRIPFISKIAKPIGPTSWITIIPLLWLVLQNTKGVIFWKSDLDPSIVNQLQIEGSSFDRIILSFLLIVAFSVLYTRKDKLVPIFKNNFWLIGLLGYMLISICWTEFPFVAFKRWIRSFGTFVMIGLLVTERDPLQAGVKVLKQACYIILPVSLALVFLAPGIGTSFAPEDGITYWTGFATHKNILGQWATLGTLLFLWLLFDSTSTLKDRALHFFMLAISWVLLIGSKSTNSLALTLEGMGIFAVFVLIKSAGRFGFITIPFSVATLGSFILLAEQFLLRKPIFSSMLNLAGKDSTLTGRTGLWEYALSIGAQKAWFGHGYATFWISKWGDRARSVLGWDMYSAHNGFLDVYLQLGIIGVGFLLFYVAFAVRGVASVYRHDFRYGMLWITFLIITLFSNWAESNFGSMAQEFWFLSLLVSFNIPYQFLKIREESRIADPL
jgi:exopolysaccharide production protein ExoQ